jgi:hypothetical protein
MAFDTTVAGLATAVVCFIVSRVRRRWYSDYLVSMESAMNTLLEKADILHARGFEFSPAMFKYDARGKKATKVALDGAGERQRAGRGDVARGGASERRGAGDVAPSLDDAQAAAE